MATAKVTHRLCIQVGSYITNVNGEDKVKPEYLEIGTVLEISPDNGGKFFEAQLTLSILQPTLFHLVKGFQKSKTSSTARVKMFEVKEKPGKSSSSTSTSEPEEDDGIPFPA